MNSIIDEIYDGRLSYEKIIKISENQKIVHKALQTEDALREKLKSAPELLELFEKYVDKMGRANSVNYQSFYATGVRIGLLLGMDAAKLTLED
ncbi:MAG: hypothetical protein K2M95_01900 [Clostridiales bacterium]|nr:hypothetical protein [Clostridiales bacterium]